MHRDRVNALPHGRFCYPDAWGGHLVIGQEWEAKRRAPSNCGGSGARETMYGRHGVDCGRRRVYGKLRRPAGLILLPAASVVAESALSAVMQVDSDKTLHGASAVGERATRQRDVAGIQADPWPLHTVARPWVESADQAA